MRPVDLFHLGPPKSGTTWLYRCLREHPQIVTSPRDSVHYFDMHHHRGDAWYAGHFGDATGDQRLFDPTPAYLRSPWAIRRIAEHNRDARLAVCLRHPVERAFSHYWHEKKKRRHDYEFGEVLRNYDLYQAWLETGFYAEHLERLLERFPREQILVQRFDDLGRDPGGFLRELLVFADVDADFTPSVLDRRINAAGPRHDAFHMGLHAVQRGLDVVGLHGLAARFRESDRLGGRTEHLHQVDPDLRRELDEICAPEIRRVETLLDLDLSDWRARPAIAEAA